MEKKTTSFLGTGWGFPPEFSAKEGGVHMVADEQDIEQSLRILLATEQGERTMLPGFGCNLSSLVFEQLTTTQATVMKDMIRTAILYHEPRIDVEDVHFHIDEKERNLLTIQVEYRIRATNSRTNIVYPFYLDEGTNVDL